MKTFDAGKTPVFRELRVDSFRCGAIVHCQFQLAG